MKTKTSDADFLGDESPLPANTVFELLRNRRRRHLLQYLGQKAGAVSLEELAEQLALREGEPTSDRFERITTGLHHEHLPTLADANVVRYDSAVGTVELLGPASQLEPFLELADHRLA